MENVASHGRTVLFVSHNMGAVQRLCSRAVLLNSGRVIEDGDVNHVTNKYMSFGLNRAGERAWKQEDAPGDEVVRLRRVRLLDEAKNVKDEFGISEPVSVEIEYAVLKDGFPLNTMCYFVDEMGATKFVSMDNLDSPWKDTSRPAGVYRCLCQVPRDFLNEGNVRIHVLVITSPYNLHACEHDVLTFKIVDDMSPKGVRGNYPREWPQAVVRPRLHWDIERFNG